MKARVKATGEEIEVMQIYEKGDSFYVRLDMLGTTEVRYHISELEFEGIELPNQSEPDYWTRLEHQYAGMAMQGILACEEWKISPREGVSFAGEVALQAQEIAHALVEKMKNQSV